MKKRYIMSGIIGSICFGIGDWLLGYVEPAVVDTNIFYFIRAGHGEFYNTQKIIAVLILAVIGILFLTAGLLHMSDFARNETSARRLRFSGASCAIGWMTLHLNVSFHVALFSETAKISGVVTAVELSRKIANLCNPLTYGSMLFIGIAFVVLSVEILRDRTYLKKSAILFAPYIMSGILMLVSMLLPNTPFAYGLYTFNMNFGLLVWFGYLFVCLLRQK